MVDAQELCEDADVDDVGHEFCDFWIDFPGEGAHGYGVGDDVFTLHRFFLRVAVPYHHGTGFQRCQILFPGCGVDENLDVGAIAGCLVAFVGEANDVPGWQTRDVGREEVFSADRNAHVEQGLQENQVRRLRPGTVCSCDVDGEVVDDSVHG